MIRKVTIAAAVLFLFSFSATKKRAFIPPGTTRITETFFADEVEISNFGWTEYELWVKTKYGFHSPEHLAALPDTLVWHDKVSYNDPFMRYYYRHPAYRDYPVVGISFEQALAFCKWRTDRVKEFYSVRYKKELHIEYRLPTKEEWELISNHGIGIFNSKGGTNEKGYRLLNCVWDSDTVIVSGLMSDHADITAPVYSYWKNSFGLFNSFGNVAEMVAEKGVCKGGSWRHRIEECRAGKDIPYSKSEAWLGFRCVCIMGK